MTAVTATPARQQKRQALLAAMLKKEGIDAAISDSIQGRPDSSRIPLSCAQLRLWFLDQLNPGSPAYNVPACFRLRGQLDIGLLGRALNQVVERHEILRTTFSVDAEGPFQTLNSVVIPLTSVTDLEFLPAAERVSQAERLLREEARRPFDLTRGPLLRPRFIRLAKDDHIVLLTMHHIVSDAWSVGVLVRELSALYEASLRGKPARLADLPIQYGDFAYWQQESLSSEPLQSQLAYWKNQLGGAPPCLELPIDCPRPTFPSDRGATVSRTFPPELARALKALSHRENTTSFITLLTAFKTLLFRYSGQSDLVVASPIANRDRAELERLIGFFPNTVLLRTNLSGDPSFADALRSVRSTALGAYANQNAPFEKVIEQVRGSRVAGHDLPFQAAFLFEEAAVREIYLPGIEVAPFDLDIGTAKCDLTLAVSEQAGGLRATFEYSTDLFHESTIDRVLDHLEVLLCGIVESPAPRLSELPLLSPMEHRQIVVDWNDTSCSFPDQACAHQLFERQASRSPDSPAVQWGTTSISYLELNRRANRLAHRLRSLDVCPEAPVAILLDRSPGMVIAVLAVMKAGGAFLPLSLYDPPERLTFVLDDARPILALTSRTLAPRLVKSGVNILHVDSEAGWQSESDANPEPAASLHNLAYIIYTSGSTGKPKGVLLEHRGLCNLAAAQKELFNAGPQNRILQFAALSFDASVWEIFLALLSGATLCLGNPGQSSSSNLSTILKDQKITLATLPPSVLAVLDSQDLPDLHTVISAGESCSDEIVRRWSKGRNFFNAYGPTETTVCATAGRCDPETGVSIGRPLSNMQAYILDANMEPVPQGARGELHIGGVGLARGYLNRPDLTASKFVANPFGSEPNVRLYKTGDIARHLPDGRIQFLGRADHQVKIRGFRVELGEVESRIMLHPEVLQCAVVAREDKTGLKKLVAYVVGRDKVSPDLASLRLQVENTCPAYMVPSTFMALPELPLTANGKVDRDLLPWPEPHRNSSTSFVRPRNELECQLVELFEELLGVKPVGITNDFFELGGTSLLAVRLIARLQQLTSRDTQLSIFNGGTTVEKIANTLRSSVDSEFSHLVALQPNGTKRPLFLVHPAGGDVLCYRRLAQLLGDDQPVCGLVATGINGDEQPLADIPSMAARYVTALQSIQAHGPYRIGGFSSGGLIAYEMARQLQGVAESVELVALLDTWVPDEIPRIDDVDVLIEVAAGHARTQGKPPLKISAKLLRRIDSEKRLPYLVARLQKAGLLGPDDPKHIERLAHVYLANITAVRSYVPAPAASPVALFRAAQGKGSSSLGWDRFLAGKLEIYSAPGDHSTFIEEPNVKALAEKLKARLEGRQAVEYSADATSASKRTHTTSPGMSAFTVIWFGQLISLLGSGLTGFGLGFWVLRSTGSITRFALISTCTVLPRILLSTFAGALVDRWDRRWTMIVSEIGSALSTLVLAALLATGKLEIWHIYVGMCAISVCTAFQWPAYSAATTVLVPPERLGNASGMVQAAQGLAQTLAPMMAGVLVGNPFVKIPGLLVIDFATYLFAVTTLVAIRIPRSPQYSQTSNKRSSLRNEIAYGWAYLLDRPGLVGLVVYLAATNFLLGTIMILVTPLVLSFASVRVLGTVMTAAGVGMFAGSAVMSVSGGPKRRMLGVFWPMFIGGLALIPAGFTTSATLIGAGAFVFLLGIPIINGCTQTLLQSKVDAGVQGRVFAITGMVAGSTMPLAYILAGPVADRVFEPLLAVHGPLAETLGHMIGVGPGRGVALEFVVLGLFLLLLTVTGFLYPRLRRLEQELPDGNCQLGQQTERLI